MRKILIVGCLAATLMAVVIPEGSAAETPELDCTGDLGDPVPGTLEWDLADFNNRWCGSEGNRTINSSPARWAAQAAAQAANPEWVDDPFREVTTRWAGKRGEYRTATMIRPDGTSENVHLLSPLQQSGPLPGVIILNEVAVAAEPAQPNFVNFNWWAAQSLAEHGYLVMITSMFPGPGFVLDREDGGRIVEEMVRGAADWFTSAANPWHARLDPTLLGLTGISGAGCYSAKIANDDPRFDAAVGWDPSGACGTLGDFGQLRTPTMVQLADYGTQNFFVPRHTKPDTAGRAPAYTWFDGFAAAGVDFMQMTPRAGSHSDAHRFFNYPPVTLYGEQLTNYYMLAWFDRYLRGTNDRQVKADATRRLTATDTFDDSADVHSIGTGHFDAYKAQVAGSVEAGNVPITIEGLRVRNMLSWWYPTRYALDGGKLRCDDVRAGCVGAEQPGNRRAQNG